MLNTAIWLQATSRWYRSTGSFHPLIHMSPPFMPQAKARYDVVNTEGAQVKNVAQVAGSMNTTLDVVASTVTKPRRSRVGSHSPSAIQCVLTIGPTSPQSASGTQAARDDCGIPPEPPPSYPADSFPWASPRVGKHSASDALTTSDKSKRYMPALLPALGRCRAAAQSLARPCAR